MICYARFVMQVPTLFSHGFCAESIEFDDYLNKSSVANFYLKSRTEMMRNCDTHHLSCPQVESDHVKYLACDPATATDSGHGAPGEDLASRQ